MLITHRSLTIGKQAGALTALVFGLVLFGCDKKPDQDQKKSEGAQTAEVQAEPKGPSKGIGPIKDLQLGPVDEALAAKGEKVFNGVCIACHKMDVRLVGPPLANVTKRRTPEWIMNMILNPMVMTQQDDTAKALLRTYMTQMSVAVSQEDARAALEFFRKHDGT